MYTEYRVLKFKTADIRELSIDSPRWEKVDQKKKSTSCVGGEIRTVWATTYYSIYLHSYNFLICDIFQEEEIDLG